MDVTHSPPLQESGDPVLRFPARGPFEKIHYGLPELYIVEVAIDRPPQGNRGKSKSHLRVQPSFIIAHNKTITMTYLASNVSNRLRGDPIHLNNLCDMFLDLDS